MCLCAVAFWAKYQICAENATTLHWMLLGYQNPGKSLRLWICNILKRRKKSGFLWSFCQKLWHFLFRTGNLDFAWIGRKVLISQKHLTVGNDLRINFECWKLSLNEKHHLVSLINNSTICNSRDALCRISRRVKIKSNFQHKI